MKNNKRLVGELLQKIDAPEIAALLLDEEDHIIRSFAAKSLAKSADFHPTFAKIYIIQFGLSLPKFE